MTGYRWPTTAREDATAAMESLHRQWAPTDPALPAAWVVPVTPPFDIGDDADPAEVATANALVPIRTWTNADDALVFHPAMVDELEENIVKERTVLNLRRRKWAPKKGDNVTYKDKHKGIILTVFRDCALVWFPDESVPPFHISYNHLILDPA